MTARGMLRKFRGGTARFGLVRSVAGLGRFARFKLMKPASGTICTTDGLKLSFRYPDQFMPTLVVFKELVEPEYQYLRHVLSRNSIFFDVGGGIGTYSVLAATIVNGPVHTFEPVAENVDTIKRNLRQNGVESKVQLNACALSSRTGFSTLQKHSKLFVSHIADVSASRAADAVSVTTIDAYCDAHKIDHIDAIKIDAEGHEQQVIEGARRLLARNAISVIILETDHRLAPFYQSLADIGFTAHYYDDRAKVVSAVTPLSEETLKNSEPSPFSSNIVLIHRDKLQLYAERLATHTDAARMRAGLSVRAV